MQAWSISLRSLGFIPRALQSAVTVGWSQSRAGELTLAPPTGLHAFITLTGRGVTPSERGDRTHLTTS